MQTYSHTMKINFGVTKGKLRRRVLKRYIIFCQTIIICVHPVTHIHRPHMGRTSSQPMSCQTVLLTYGGAERHGVQNSNINHTYLIPKPLPFGLKTHSTTYGLVMNGFVYGAIMCCHKQAVLIRKQTAFTSFRRRKE
jgi:hypothetical protein